MNKRFWCLLCGIPFSLIAASAMLTVMRPAQAQDASELTAQSPPPNAIWLGSLDLSKMTQGWGKPTADKSVDGNPITLNGVVYPHGVGTHAISNFNVDLKGVAVRFVSMVGVDDEKKGLGSVDFRVWVDDKKVADSGVMHGGDPAKLISVNLTGAKMMRLEVTDANDGIDNDHADWAGAMIFLEPGATVKPVAVDWVDTSPMPVIADCTNPPAKPEIHGPRITGATPGRPFLFMVPVTGKEPLTFHASGLPAGLKINPHTGIITGALKASGVHVVTITVHGPAGTAKRDLTIVGGIHKLALTPPLGWNSWNVWAGAVDDANVRSSALAMVKSGLAAHGFQYINIDDTWEDGRDAQGFIQSNKKFPNMKALADYVHSLGLKIGIYSSPGPKTCGGYEGSYQHEQQDADTYAKWGIDYLKYDWCSYGSIAKNNSLPELQKPYKLMRSCLDKVDRDIVFSFCQYGMGDVWKWGAQCGGNLWRCTGDINDSWGSMAGNGFSQSDHYMYAGPGHWNDPDMLVVGYVGWGNPHKTHLTYNEQITHISLWSMIAAPLLLGCDMSKLDKFTLDLLCNDDVLDVDQDPLGKAGHRYWQHDSIQMWARPLWDGTMAVALFNTGEEPHKGTVLWSDIGLKGKQLVRNLWLKKNLGYFANGFSAEVPPHGTVLIKVGKPKNIKAYIPPKNED
jgi:alpha-galactosidase